MFDTAAILQENNCIGQTLQKELGWAMGVVNSVGRGHRRRRRHRETCTLLLFHTHKLYLINLGSCTKRLVGDFHRRFLSGVHF